MIFGRRSAVPSVRPRGALDRLPIDLDLSTSSGTALPKILGGAIFAVLGYNMLGGMAGGGDVGSVAATVFQLAPYVILLAGLVVLTRGIVGLVDRKSARIQNGMVSVTRKSLFGSENWSEPLSAFDGVRWREIVVEHSNRTSGASNRSHLPPLVYQVLDLKHPDPRRCVPLYVTRLNERGGRAAERFRKALEGSDDSRAKAYLREVSGEQDEGLRQKWESLSRLLGVSAIDATGEDVEVRAVEDLDKSVAELAAAGKVEADLDQSSPPPPGLEAVHKGDPADPAAQEILVTIRARRFPLWLYGVLLAAAAILLILGVFDLAFLPIMFGVGLGAGVYWYWNSEGKNPRTVRITRTEVELNTPNPGNKPNHHVIPHGEIEGVRITNRYNQSAIGPRIEVVTDRGEHTIGAGLSTEALAWLRDLIQSAVVKA